MDKNGIMTLSFPPLPRLHALFSACALVLLPPLAGAAWADPQQNAYTGGRSGGGHPVSFSAEQVTHGAQIYAGACAICHGTDREGGHDVPDLSTYFAARWANTPLDRLSGYISRAMPLMAPGTLPPQDTAALVAFLLHENGVASATNAPLPTEESRLAKFRFPAPRTLTGNKP